MIQLMTAYINLVAYAAVTIYQLYLIWTNRHIRQRYGQSRIVTLWSCLLITLYLSLAYYPIAFRLVGPEFAPVWIRPFFWLPAVGMGLLAWYVHRDQRAQEQAAAERAELNRLREELITNLSHEIYTPLTPLVGYPDMILAEDRLPPEDQLRDMLRAIRNNARRLFLLFNRLVAGAHVYRPADVDLVGLVGDVAAGPDIWLATRRVAGEVEIFIKPTTKPIVATADEGKLQIVVYELIHNAIKFGAAVVTVSVSEDDSGWQIAVADDGVGIAAVEQANIFEPFRQVNGTGTRRYEGAGLGLWAARKLVELHGGQIVVESELGQGSTFVIRLPR